MKTFFLSMAGALVALLLFFIGGFLVLAGIIGAASASDPQPDNMVLTLDLREEFSDQAPATGFAAFSGEIGFTDIMTRLEGAMTDDSVAGLYVRGSDFGMGSARAEELRGAILDFRDAGKFVIAHSQGTMPNAGPSGLRGIVAADEVWLQPGTEISVSGIAFETQFLKGLFDRLSITAEIEQFHEYKNAPNIYKQTGFTDAHREAMTALADDLWTVSTRDIADDRAMTVDQLTALLEAGPVPAEAAQAGGLVDQLGWPADAEAAALTRAGEDAALVSMAEYAPPVAPSRAPMIAVVGGEGAIVSGYSNQDLFASSVGFGSDSVAAAIREAGDDEKVEAIVFRVDSGGGSATASDQIWQAVEAVQAKGKPVVVSMGSVAASGGYYVSAGADHIVANETTITGSIGVFAGKFAIADGLEQIGITSGTVAVGGSYADAWGTEAFSDEDRATLRASLTRTYDRFLDIVADGRGMTVEEADARARGRVWSGQDALDRGLIDSLGGFRDAISTAKALADIDAETDVRLIHFPARRSGFEALDGFVAAGDDAADTLALIQAISTNRQVRALVSDAEALHGQGVQARMPAVVER
ncbi:MAG: signal peptide peptidase SppA [Pseudomonadota bacterium]